jgi:hypothetical protein
MKRAFFALLVALPLCVAGPVTSLRAADRDVVFTHGPTDATMVDGVIPLGNLNPRDNHVLAVDHMYLNVPIGRGITAVPVYAMANGTVVMIARWWHEDLVKYDYGIWMQHSAGVTSYFIHVTQFTTRIIDQIQMAPDAWTPVAPGFDIMLFGQGAAPPRFSVTGGERLAYSFGHTWDVGVIDTRVRGAFLGRGERRYPTLDDYIAALGLPYVAPYPGQQTLNAACFIDYLAPAIRSTWFDLLASSPKWCGFAGHDVSARLRGAWFSTNVDAAPEPPLFQLQTGALSVIPDNLRPLTHVQIGIGSGGLSGLDPDDLLPQLDDAFFVAVDFTPGARVNPDPTAVRARTGTVCYDLRHNAEGAVRYNALFFNLAGGRGVQVKLDATAYAAPACATSGLPEPDGSWAAYVR